MNETIKVFFKKPRNLITKDLRSPKYRMRVVDDKRNLSRNELKFQLKRELSYD